MLDCPPPKYTPHRHVSTNAKTSNFVIRYAREALRVQALYPNVPEFAAVHASRLFSIAENNGLVLQ